MDQQRRKVKSVQPRPLLAAPDFADAGSCDAVFLSQYRLQHFAPLGSNLANIILGQDRVLMTLSQTLGAVDEFVLGILSLRCPSKVPRVDTTSIAAAMRCMHVLAGWFPVRQSAHEPMGAPPLPLKKYISVPGRTSSVRPYQAVIALINRCLLNELRGYAVRQPASVRVAIFFPPIVVALAPSFSMVWLVTAFILALCFHGLILC